VGINGMQFERESSGSYASGQIGMDHFDIVKVVGRGSFGKVYLVRKKDDGKVFAMKTLKKDMILRKN
jgi:p70 ribosomal S6 kinase